MRIIRVSNKKELESRTSEFIMMGYSMKTATEETASLKKTEYGSFLLHVILFFLTAGIGNVIYLIVKMMGGDEVLIKMEKDD